MVDRVNLKMAVETGIIGKLKEELGGDIAAVYDKLEGLDFYFIEEKINALYEAFTLEEIARHLSVTNLYVLQNLTLENQVKQLISDNIIPDILQDISTGYSSKWLYSCGEVIK